MNVDEIIVTLAERLGKERALRQDESIWLEASLRRHLRAIGVKRPFWQPKDDQALKRHLSRNRTAREIARAMGKSEDAIRSRIRVLRGHTGHRRKQGHVAAQQAAE